MNSRALARRRGMAAEHHAREFLEKQGLKTLARNYHAAQGEIDLVMDDRGTLVFVEVRYRTAGSLVDAAESVDHRKQRRIVQASRAYLASGEEQVDRDCRFDVITFTGDGRGSKIEWIKDAFDA